MNYTRQLLLIPLLLLLAITGNAQSFGSFASGVFFNKNGTPTTYNLTGDGTPNEIGPGAPGFTGNLGSFGVHSKNLKMHYTNDAKLILDLANLRDGMYFIKVLQNGKTATAKFTKQQ